jgi:hypothetical protein
MLKAAACLVLALAAGARAELTGIKDREIKCDGKLLATVNMDKPKELPVGTSGGMSMNGSGLATANLKGELQWIQVVITDVPLKSSTKPGEPYLAPGDLYESGNDYPFFWNIDPKGRDGNEYPQYYYKNKQFANGMGLSYDTVAQRSFDPNVDVRWRAELSLVCWDRATNKLGVLWTGKFGFTLNKNGTQTVFGIDELATPVELTRKLLDGRFGQGKYTLSTDCHDCLVPSPGACWVLGFALVAPRRRRVAWKEFA